LYVACFYRSEQIYCYLKGLKGDAALEAAFPRSTTSLSLMMYALIAHDERPVNEWIVRDLIDEGVTLAGSLEYAILTGSVDVFDAVFEALCRSDDPVSCLFEDTKTKSPLELAIRSGSVEMVQRIRLISDCEERLLRIRPTSSMLPAYQRTPLYCAIRGCNADIVQLFMHEPLLDDIDQKTGETVLIAYVKSARVPDDRLKELVLGSSDIAWAEIVNVRDKRGRTALHWACDPGDGVPRHWLIRALLNHDKIKERLEPGLLDKWGMSPLHDVTCSCDPDALHMLFTYIAQRGRDRALAGYQIETDRDKLGRNQLHTAARQCCANCPDFASQRDAPGLVPVLYTTIYRLLPCLEFFCNSRYQNVVTSISTPAELTKWTVLHYAAHPGAVAILRYILQFNSQSGHRLFPDINELAEEPPRSPLFLAVQKGNLECVLVLVAYGADPTKPQGGTERTPHDIIQCLELRDALNMDRSEAFERIS
jgi:ankyrin repeat protein